MTTFTVANINDVLTNPNWSFDGSNFLIGQPGVGIVIGEVTPTDETNSVNVSGGYYINNVNISTTFATGTLSASNGLVVTGKGVELGAPTGGQPSGAGGINATSYLLNGQNIATGKVAYGAKALLSGSTTTSTGLVMLGLGAAVGGTLFTPRVSGNVFVSITSSIVISTTSAMTAILAFGTGTPPAQGAAATGTAISDTISASVAVANTYAVTVPIIGALAGLTLGTQYWVDVQWATGAGTLTWAHSTVAILEI